MELKLTRIISTSKGTNGYLAHMPKPNLPNGICKTIELPWRKNMPQQSCIPEGRYELQQRHSEHFGDHLILLDVPERSLILMHPANDALKELKGCIAPVLSFNGVGNGNYSRAALKEIMGLVNPAFAAGEKVWLTIVLKTK